MIYGGDGLGRLPEDKNTAAPKSKASPQNARGKAVFVPFVLESERVEVELKEQHAGFARATLQSVIAPSPQRVPPPCPYFGRCGGCQYQHTGYEHQLEIKSGILRETLLRTAKITLEVPLQVHAGEPWQYRNRTRMKVRTTPAFALGYFRNGSHELLPVEECPISSPLINQAVSAVWEVGNTGVDPSLREVQFFANHDDTEVLLELYIDRNGEPENFRKFAMNVMVALPKIAGIVIFQSVAGGENENDRSPLSTSRGPSVAVGRDFLRYNVGGEEYHVSGGSFFQTNRFLAETLVNLVVGGRKGATALDLYAGTGLFTMPLSRKFERVTAVESAPYSFADLAKNAPRGSKAVQATTEDFLTLKRSATNFDLVVVDPPRAGLGEKVSRALGRMNTPRVTYVSCDPATLSRDLRILLESGFRVESAHLVDLFPQTFHMESVFHLVR